MPVVVIAARGTHIQRVGFTNAVPDRSRPFDPVVVADVGLDGYRIVSRLTEHEDVVGQRRPEPRGVLAKLSKPPRLRVRADRLGLRIFVDADLAVVDPPLTGVEVNDGAAKIAESDHTITRLLHRGLTDMDCREPPRL